MRANTAPKALTLGTAASLSAVVGLTLLPSTTASKRGGAITELEQHFTPEQTFAFVLPPLRPVPGVDGVRAADCGVCHQRVWREWQETTHAAALRDPQFQAEIFKSSSPRWLCLNCHIPVESQRRERVLGLLQGDVLRPVTAANPGFDPELMQEAITCAACHVRPDATGQSEVIGPRGNPLAPHPVRADREGLRSVCLRCHDPQGEAITPQLVCWFETKAELASGPWRDRADCVDCHMPPTRRRLADDFVEYPERSTPQHHWVGGGVPKEFAAYDGLLARGYRPGLTAHPVQVTRGRQGAIDFSITLENSRAGHKLPTADPERFLLARARLRDRTGRCQESASLRIGQTWRWHPRAIKVADNRLLPGEQRVWRGQLRCPDGAAAKSLQVTVLHVRLSSDNARHMKQATVEETYVPGVAATVREIERHYPMASVVHRETVDLKSGRRLVATADELVALSKAERLTPLAERGY